LTLRDDIVVAAESISEIPSLLCVPWPTAVSLLNTAPALRRKTTNCFNADYPDSADEAFQRSSLKSIARWSIGDALLVELLRPDHP
jgi:hypothetical protein